MPEKDKCEETSFPESHQEQKFNLGRRMAVILLASIFIGEILIMVIVQSFRIQSGWFEAFLDSLLLLVLTLPAVYFLAIRPLTTLNTKRKHAEDALNNALSLTEATLESIHNGILVVDDKGVVVKTNARFAKMWRIPDEVLASGDDKTLLDSILEQLSDPEWFITSVSDLYSKPDAESFDLLYFKDGRIFERISKPFYLWGKPHGRVWSFLDVTDRKQAEEALRNSEAHLHTLVQTIPDLIWLKDKDGAYLSCNTLFESLVGVREEEIIGKTDYDLFGKEDAEFFRENDRKAMINGKSTKNEEWLTFSDDGRRVLVDVIKTPMYDSKGKFVGVLGMGHDITIRKRAEEALRESEENYRYLFANNPQPMWIFDLETLGFLEVNKAATDHYGYSKEEFMKMTLKDLRSVEDRSYFQNKTFRTDDSSGPIGEYRHAKKNGEIIFVEVSAHTVFYQGRKARHVLVHDITDRKRAESEITLKNEELIQAHAEKDKFFSIIAHDLRSPFSSFLGLTQVMAEELPNLTMTQVQEIAVSMKNSATNLHQLLENLLQWAQVQQGSIPFNPKKIGLLQLVDESIATIQEPARNKGIDMAYYIPDNLSVYADNNILQTVIRNLTSNAVKFTPRGGTISLAAKTTDANHIEISVKDSGIGMNPTLVSNLFRIDVQTSRKGTEGEPSTGLGLMLCKEFIEKHKGRLWVESEEGVGSTFYFTIPGDAKSQITR